MIYSLGFDIPVFVTIMFFTVLPDAVETPLWDQNGPAAMKPVNTLPAKRVAEFILYLIDLPRDTYLSNPVIAPMKQRKKRRRKS